MPKDTPLLTFAIPTFNRARKLNQILGILQEQMRSETRVELIVSDNASSDSTADLVTEYQNRGLTIQYIRNKSNIGADRNILQCYEQAAGKYVWIFGDDDLIAPGTLSRVLDALSSQRYDLVCIRAYFFEGEYTQHQHFTPVSDLDLLKSEDIARNFHVFLTFISGIIVNKERISSVPHESFDSLLGTNLVQLGPVYTVLNCQRRSLIIRDPLIAATGNSNNVNYALYHAFGPALSEITHGWIEAKSIQQAIFNAAIQTFFPFFILITRQSNAPRFLEDPHQVLCSCYGNNFRYWIFDYPIYALPLPLAKVWLLAVRAMNKLTCRSEAS